MDAIGDPRRDTELLAAGNVTNAPDQTSTRMQVFYARCREKAAAQVAALLRLRGDFALRPIPRTLAALAGTQAGAVVVVGTDRMWADRG